MKDNKIKILTVTLTTVLILCLAIPLIIIAFKAVSTLSEPSVRAKFLEFINSLGIFGVIIMLLIQILQIIIAVIPGEPIEVIMGLLYGTFGGFLLTILGIVIGEALVYHAVRKFGINFASKFVNTDKFSELSFLNNSKNRSLLVFLLFFIPGTPKDLLTYFVPFTKMPPFRFIVLSGIARIPSVITSTWAGASISDGNPLKTLLIFAVTGIIGILGIIINNRITNSKGKLNDKNNE